MKVNLYKEHVSRYFILDWSVNAVNVFVDGLQYGPHDGNLVNLNHWFSFYRLESEAKES